MKEGDDVENELRGMKQEEKKDGSQNAKSLSIPLHNTKRRVISNFFFVSRTPCSIVSSTKSTTTTGCPAKNAHICFLKCCP